MSSENRFQFNCSRLGRGRREGLRPPTRLNISPRSADSICEVESVDEDLAKKAGEALALVTDGGTVDALVMASASRRSDAVPTSDPKDLNQLRTCFRRVSIISG